MDLGSTGNYLRGAGEQNVSEYDQEIPQSHTAYQPTTLQKIYICKTIIAKQPAFVFLFKMIAKLEWTKGNE